MFACKKLEQNGTFSMVIVNLGVVYLYNPLLCFYPPRLVIKKLIRNKNKTEHETQFEILDFHQREANKKLISTRASLKFIPFRSFFYNKSIKNINKKIESNNILFLLKGLHAERQQQQ